MKKRHIVGIVFLLILSFALCACSSGDESGKKKEEEKETGASGEPGNTTEEGGASWKKTEIQKPEGAAFIYSLNYLADGSIRISTADQEYQNAAVWDSGDNGKNWKDAGVDTSQESDDGYHYSAEGNLYTYKKGKLSIWAENNEEKTIDISGNGSLSGTAMAGNKMALLVRNQDSMQYRVEIYDLGTMESRTLDNKELSEYLNSEEDISGLALDSTGETLYIAGKGIGRYDLKGDQFGYLMDYDALKGLIDAGKEFVSSLAVDGKEEKLILSAENPEQNQSKLYLCEKGAGGSGKQASKETLRIYSLKENGIRQAAALFQEKHPELAVTFETGYTGEEGVTLSDAIRTLNTELMAGEGPDILLLDGLPADSYIEKGILEDVTDTVKPEKEKLFYNIISAYNGGEKIYQVPTAFSVPVLLGKKDVTDSKDSRELMDVLKKQAGGQTPAMTAGNLAGFAGSMFITSDLLKDTVDEGELAEFYRGLQTIGQSLPDGELQSVEDWERPAYWAEQYPAGSSPELALYFGKAQMGTDFLSSYETCMQILALCKEKGFSYGHLNQAGGNHFTANGVLGINHTGKHVDEAKEFLKYYLSEEVQSDGMYTGFSVLRDSVDKEKYVSENGESAGTVSEKDTPEEEMELHKLTPAEFKELTGFFEKLDTPVRDDAVVLQKVMEQAEACLFEGKSPEDAAKEVCSEVNLYLSE